ncbi:asparaginyl-tRNA synthetase [Teratosphaeria nubilosa]|uniref:asparagine--tRNA ligase n=1 Tax=Teratosphaeria nubilosa TaxID=161662 RepID=A0A6G1L6W8_9PEZI|nr:asparaginyl-tRNA synthetase [Teratosphaeria nubilosa]
MTEWICARCISRLRSSAHRTFSTSRAYRERGSVASLLARNAEADHVTVHGWVRRVRRQKKVAFAAIGDGSSLLPVQAVLKPDDAAQLSTGAAVSLFGSWRASHGAKQSHELQAREVQVLGDNDAEHNPIQPKYQTPEYLRTLPHLRPRIPTNTLLLRLRSQVIASTTSFFNRAGFIQCHTPIITSSDCEGAGEVFTVSSNHHPKPPTETPIEHFFRTPKYLTVSAQLHLEALSQAVDKVWTLSPTFRAEKSDTPRHLSEFYMLEAEQSFTQNLSDVMTTVENLLNAISTDLHSSKLAEELLKPHQDHPSSNPDHPLTTPADTLTDRWTGLASSNWPRIPYTTAITHLQTAASHNPSLFATPPTHPTGLQAEHERYLAATLGRNRHPIFITDYPAHQKPFYMSPSSQDTVSSFDLLVPDLCELAGGSLREHRAAELLQAMQAKGVEGKDLEWYQDLRRYGSVPHGGFGLGFDRLLCYLSGVGNVRDVVAFPRWYGRAEC